MNFTIHKHPKTRKRNLLTLKHYKALKAAFKTCYHFPSPFIFLSVAARIGEGILLDHATGVVIGETAVVGNRVSLMHVS